MNILQKIVADKRQEVEQRILQMPEALFTHQLEASDRDFFAALYNQAKGSEFNPGFILEVKQASPSKGLIREEFILEDICEHYAQYATCISVLTDEKYFQGQFERIPKVKKLCPQPILCKDFFIDPYQVKLARHFGANAILLMLSVLDDEQYQVLASEAVKWNMTILTEVSNEQEMQRAIELNANLIGINNRNLRDLSTDLSQTPKLVEYFINHTNDTRKNATLLISESGIYHHQQTRQLSKWVDGFLVGSSLMAQPDIGFACKQLIHGTSKVCGITRAQDAVNALNAGADYLGLIMVKDSPRCISLEQAQQIIEEVPAAKWVLVARNTKVETLGNWIKTLSPYAIQLHGDETEQDIAQLRRVIDALGSAVQIWRAFGVMDTLPDLTTKADKILLDSRSANGQSGGTGEVFNWQLFEQLPLQAPPVFLAGGLSVDNIADALTRPISGVDINSGVEDRPGIKSKIKLEQVFQVINNRYPRKEL